MPLTLKPAPFASPTQNSPRFTTVEQFIDEYDKGSSLPIDLDPRIDLTKPVYEQVVALRAKDNAAGEHSTRRKSSKR